MESKTAMVFTPAKLRYLLVLAQIAQENGGQVRCIEIAVRMGVARASVSRMLNTFVKEELVLQETARGSVRLTEKGLKAAERYMNRILPKPYKILLPERSLRKLSRKLSIRLFLKKPVI